MIHFHKATHIAYEEASMLNSGSWTSALYVELDGSIWAKVDLFFENEETAKTFEADMIRSGFSAEDHMCYVSMSIHKIEEIEIKRGDGMLVCTNTEWVAVRGPAAYWEGVAA